MKKKLINQISLDGSLSSHNRKEHIKVTLTEHSTIQPRSKRSNAFLALGPPVVRLGTNSKVDEAPMKLKVDKPKRSQSLNRQHDKLPPIFSPIRIQSDSTYAEPASSLNSPPRFIKKMREANYENESCMTISNNDFRRGLPFKHSIDDKEDKTIAITKRLNTESHNKEFVCFIPNKSHLQSRYMDRNKRNSKILIKAKSISSKNSSLSSIDEEDKLKNPLSNKSFGLSQPGKNKSGLIKTNQDSFLLIEKVLGLNDYSIYGVMDGHGTNGNHVSQFVSSEAQKFFSNESNYNIPKDTIVTSQLIKEKLEYRDYSLIKFFYKKMSQELPDAKFDVHFSGTTCVIVFMIDKKVICANTGDSRAILIKESNSLSMEDKNDNDPFTHYNTVYLSLDHKPENKEEKERIESLGGFVDQYPEDGIKSGPYRVWIKGETYPGIAISRTLGDEVAESVGVIYNPDIITKEMNGNDRYFVIASDGVWEFLDNSRVMEIINPFYLQDDPEGACNAIISESTQWWEKEDIVIDDITVIVVFLRNNYLERY